MNCGCILKGDVFSGNQTILEACVLHLAWAGEKVREKDLQIHDYRSVIEVAVMDLKAAQDLGQGSQRLGNAKAALEHVLRNAGIREKRNDAPDRTSWNNANVRDDHPSQK